MQRGHARFGAFPTIIGDDLYVDTRFDAHEKAVIRTDPSVRKTPADAKSLLAVLRRHHRGVAELSARERGAAHASPGYGFRHCGRGYRDHSRSPIGSRCGGVPRDGARGAKQLPALRRVGARRKQPIERVT